MAVTSSGSSSCSNSYMVGTMYANYSCDFWETDVNVANNTSKVSWSGSVSYSHSMNYAFSGYTRSEAGWARIYVGGTLRASASCPMDSGMEPGYRIRTLSGKTGEIAHNNDGSKKVTCRVDIDSGSDPYGGGFVWSSSAGSSKDLTLTTIARASVPSVNDYPNSKDIPINQSGGKFYIHMNKKISNATHKVVVNYGNNRSLTVGTSVADNVQFDMNQTVDGMTWIDRFLADKPNDNPLTGSVTVTTYLNGSQIGSAQTVKFKITFPSDAIEATYKPVFASTPTIAEIELDDEGVPALTVVRYISKKRVTAVPTARGGSTIKSVVAYAGNRSYSMTNNGGTYTGDMDNMDSSSLKVVITDSRGFTNTYTFSGTSFIEYIYPTITSAALSRTNVATGATVINAFGKFYNGTIGNITNQPQFTYKFSDSTVVNLVTPTKISNDWNVNNYSVGNCQSDKAFTAAVTITDSFNQKVTINIQLPSAESTLWVGKNTVRVHDYLIADNDVWLNNGAVKLSELSTVKSNLTSFQNSMTRRMYEYSKQHNNAYNQEYEIKYTVSGSGFVFVNLTAIAVDNSEGNYGWLGCRIFIHHNGSWIEQARNVFRQSSSGYRYTAAGANAAAMFNVVGGDTIGLYSGKSFDGNVNMLCKIMAFGCTLTKSAG